MEKLILLLTVIYIAFFLACSDQSQKKEEVRDKQSSTRQAGEQQVDRRVELSATDRTIKFYQTRIKLRPESHSNYTKLGEAYIQKARESGDMDYYNKAEESLKKALELSPSSYATVVFLGQVSSAKHEFREALAYAKKAIELEPGDSYAYGVLGDAYIELGEYDKAEEAYERMLNLNPDLYSYSRISYINELRGDTRGAIGAMQKAIEYGIRQNLPGENIAWAQSILGEVYFNKGDLKKAEGQYKESLKTFDSYYYALAGLAKVRAAEGSYREAAELYEKAISIVPLPSFVSSLGDVYKKMGDTEGAKKQYDLVEYIGLLSKVNEIMYNRELALFYADHDMKLDEALQLAKRELEAREDIYTYDTLAWALYKRNNLKGALEASRQSLRLGTKDARLFFHAGMIYYKLGELDKAEEYLNKATSANPHFHVIYSETVKDTLEAIENKSQAANSKGAKGYE